VEKSHRPDASGHNILEEGSGSPGSLLIAISLRPLSAQHPGTVGNHEQVNSF
jgi:hypothetical protein